MHLHANRIDLDIEGNPYIIYGIVLLCLLIQFHVSHNHHKIEVAADSYCAKIHHPLESHAFIRDKTVCRQTLLSLHHRSLTYDLKDGARLPEWDLVIQHYESFVLNAPVSVQAKMAYDSTSWNPFKLLVSSLAHRDWEQFWANISLLLVFATMIELLSMNRFVFIIGLLFFTLASGYFASLAAWFTGQQHYVMGISGIVVGTIGMAAYLVPQAKIRAQFGKFFFLPFWIPVWSYVAVFIAWDLLYIEYHDSLGLAQFAGHLFGLALGFYLGYGLFGHRKEDIQDELQEVLSYQKSRRQDFFGTLSSYIGDTDRQLEDIRSRQRKQDWAKFENRLRNLINVYEDAVAMAVLLDNHEFYVDSIEIYEDLFEEIGKWRKGKAYLCLGRLIIGVLLAEKKYARAFLYTRRCLDHDEGFLPGSPEELVQLVKHARAQQEFDLGLELMENAKSAYELENFLMVKEMVAS